MFEPDTDDPVALFERWYAEAQASVEPQPDAMALATADGHGRPSVRMVLVKGADRRGFVFYTHLDSRKGEELAASPQAALCFHWKALGRQVRVEGPVEPVTGAEADAYFASRGRISRIGAAASRQSRPLANREVLLQAVAELERAHPGDDIPRPESWSGFRVVPDRIEFWQQGEHRLHDRFQFERTQTGWTVTRLYP